MAESPSMLEKENMYCIPADELLKKVGTTPNWVLGDSLTQAKRCANGIIVNRRMADIGAYVSIIMTVLLMGVLFPISWSNGLKSLLSCVLGLGLFRFISKNTCPFVRLDEEEDGRLELLQRLRRLRIHLCDDRSATELFAIARLKSLAKPINDMEAMESLSEMVKKDLDLARKVFDPYYEICSYFRIIKEEKSSFFALKKVHAVRKN